MYKKILILSFLFIINSTAMVSAESIENYKVTLTINKDSKVNVREEIDYDFGLKHKHGIFRFIPIFFNVEGQKSDSFFSKKREIKISNFHILKNGKSENIAEINKNKDGNYFVKVGSENKLISGKQKYILEYRVSGAMRYFNDFDEFYWNAIGTGWTVPIKNFEIILKSKNDFLTFKNHSCYQGALKSQTKCSNELRNADIYFYSNTNSNKSYPLPKEGVTIASSFDKDLIIKEEFWAVDIKSIIPLLIGVILTFLGLIFMRFKKLLNVNNERRPIIPVYKPYENYHPSLMGLIIDNKFDGRDLTAGIISLAQKKYIEIEQMEISSKLPFFRTKHDYTFRLKVDLSKIKNELDKIFINFPFFKE